MKYFQVFVDEASRDKHVVGLKTRDAATDATGVYIDEMTREGVAIKCMSGDGANLDGQSNFNACWPIGASSSATHRRGHRRVMESLNAQLNN